MHIKKIRIENLKSIKYFEVDNLPELVVFAGPNGTGKSTVLEAINIWKQSVAAYNLERWIHERDYGKLIRNGETFAKIGIEIKFSEKDKKYLKGIGKQGDTKLGDKQYIIITISSSRITKQENIPPQLEFLLRYPDRGKYPYAPVFDYYGPHRFLPPRDFSTFNSNALEPENEQRQLIQASYYIQEKARNIKEYFYSINQKDLEWYKRQQKDSKSRYIDKNDAPNSFTPISKLIQDLLPHIKFEEVTFGNPVEFLFSTPQGKLVNIDGLSSGEKEILSLFIEIYRKELENSIIIIDEPELHLNQAVESRIIPCIQNSIVSKDNQVFIATHSSGIISSINESNLFRINFPSNDSNQCIPITSGKEKIDMLKTLVGDLAIFTTAEKFVFLEGKKSNKSFDKKVLEILFPELKGKVTFIPCGSHEVVEIISKKVQQILESEIPFGDFYAIRDRDRLRDEEIQSLKKYLPNFAVLSRCMLENYLLDVSTWEKLLTQIGKNLSKTEIESKFELAAKNIIDKELNLRISDYFQKKLSKKDFLDHPNFSTIQKLDKFLGVIETEKQNFPNFKAKLIEEINAEIDNGSFIKKFHGKNLMKELKSVFAISMSDDSLYPLIANIMYEKKLIPSDLIETIEHLNL